MKTIISLILAIVSITFCSRINSTAEKAGAQIEASKTNVDELESLYTEFVHNELLSSELRTLSLSSEDTSSASYKEEYKRAKISSAQATRNVDSIVKKMDSIRNRIPDSLLKYLNDAKLGSLRIIDDVVSNKRKQ